MYFSQYITYLKDACTYR